MNPSADARAQKTKMRLAAGLPSKPRLNGLNGLNRLNDMFSVKEGVRSQCEDWSSLSVNVSIAVSRATL